MFHSQSLSRKGPLGSIWVAAYCYKRLKKAQVTQTDIPHSVDTILQDEFDVVAYRVLAYFLLGVVRIFSKKVEYLFDDCHKVLVNVKAFVVSNKKDKHAKIVTTPPLSLITVPKSFELDAFDLEVLEDLSGGNAMSREDITLADKTRRNKGIWEYSPCEHHWAAGHDTFCSNDNPVYNVSSPQPLETDAAPMQIDAGPSSVEEQNNLQASVEKPQESSFTQEESMNLLTLHKYKEDIMEAGKPSTDDSMTGREQTENVEVTLSVKETLTAADDRGDDGGMFCASPKKIQSDGYVESMNIDTAGGVDKEHVELTVKPDEREAGKPSSNDNMTDREQTENEEVTISVKETLPAADGRGDDGVDKEHMELTVKPDEREAGKPSSDDNMTDREQTENVEVTISVKETLPAADGGGDDGGMFCASPEKIRSDGYVESMNIDTASGVDKEHVELTVKPDERLLTFLNGDRLTVPSPQSLEPLVMKDHPISAQLNATPEPKRPDPQGATTPDFLLIPTPRVKERPRTKRKKSCLYDELIVLPNELLKKSIIDSSELVCKRRKAPHTAFAAWKVHRRSHLSFEYVEPLMSGMSPELRTLFSENNIKISEVHEPPGGIEKIDVEGPEKIDVFELRMFDGSSERIEIAPETPDLRTSARRPFSSPKEDFRLDQNGPIVFSEVTNLVVEQNEQGDYELDFLLMTEEPQETGVPKDDDDEFGHWTGRTRLVARCFHKIFKIQKKRRKPEAVSLLHVSERKTAKESARLFYEILVLKSRRYVDVEQDDAYGDVIVKKDSKWEQAFGARSP